MPHAILFKIGVAFVSIISSAAIQLKKSEDTKVICKFFLYNLSNPYAGGETNFQNYTILDYFPTIPPQHCPSSGVVCWIRICDQTNDGDVDEFDFDSAVWGWMQGMGLDRDWDGQISDDQMENGITYEEKRIL